MNISRITCLSGLVGAMMIILGVLVPALAFEGAYGEAFSILNHNISELGEQGVSELAWLFNASMMLAGLFLLVFMSGLSLILRRWPVYIITLAGIVTATGIVMIGLYPMVDGETVGRHMLAAHLFFYGGMFSSLLFSLYACCAADSVFPRGVALAGTLAAISFAAFIYLPRMIYPGFTVQDYLVRLQGAGRPVLWLPSLLEWIVLFAAVFWIVMMARAICILSRRPSSVSSSEERL